MTAWERSGDTKWRDKIMAGVDSMYAMPYWMRTGKNLVMGYDYNTGKLYQVNDTPGSYNLPTIQGGAEVAFEMTGLLNNDEWTKMWLQYCRVGSANADVLTKDKTTGTEGADATLAQLPQFACKDFFSGAGTGLLDSPARSHHAKVDVVKTKLLRRSW
jgi:hypothetical protein